MQSPTYNDDPYGIAAFAAQQAQAQIEGASASIRPPADGAHNTSTPMDQDHDEPPNSEKRPLTDTEAEEDDPPQKQGRPAFASALPAAQRQSRVP